MASEYLAAAEKLQASEILSDLAVADFPNLKQDARRKMHRDLSKTAAVERKEMSFEAFAKKMGHK